MAGSCDGTLLDWLTGWPWLGGSEIFVLGGGRVGIGRSASYPCDDGSPELVLLVVDLPRGGSGFGWRQLPGMDGGRFMQGEV